MKNVPAFPQTVQISFFGSLATALFWIWGAWIVWPSNAHAHRTGMRWQNETPNQTVGSEMPPATELPAPEKTNPDRVATLRQVRPRPSNFVRPVIIELRGEIEPSQTAYFRNRLRRAKAFRADLVVIEIDSPGGWKTESLAIGEMLRDVDWAYVVAYVPREAISGAALLALGADEIICDPKMRFGDIGPIQWDPAEFAFRLVPAKLQSVLVREARDLAEAKGHSPDLAEAMIDKDVLVFTQQTPEGIRQFKRAHVSDPQMPAAPWELIEESGPERFLTLNGIRAQELGLASTLVTTREQLAAELKFELRAANVFQYQWSDSVARILNSWWATAMLVIVGLLALYFELSSPGVGVGAMIAGLCGVLFFWSHFLGGTADWLEVLLFLSGLILICMELFVIPGWGISGVLGLMMLFLSVVMACQDFVVPSNADQWNQFLTSTLMMLCSLFIVMIGAAWITKKLGRMPVLNQLVLVPQLEPDPSHEDSKSAGSKPAPRVHPRVSVGDWGQAESPLRPAGRASFAGHSIDVVSDGQFINPGQRVKVIRIQGHVVVVTETE